MWPTLIAGSLRKRSLDIIGALIGLMISFPLILCVAVAIKLNSAGPVFYRQMRLGLNERPFTIYKFRTMVVHAEQKGSLTGKSDSRVTSVGKWLRRFEIDEIPTLLNVLRGDMSIVGPRPEVAEYVEIYTKEQRRVLTVRPGMTDIGTLRFRNETELLEGQESLDLFYREIIMPEKLRLNLEYIDKQSFLFDLRIVLETLALLIRQPKG